MRRSTSVAASPRVRGPGVHRARRDPDQQREHDEVRDAGSSRRSYTKGSVTPVSGISRVTPADDHERLQREDRREPGREELARTRRCVRSRSAGPRRSGPGTAAGPRTSPSMPSSSPIAAKMKSLSDVRDQPRASPDRDRCPRARRSPSRTSPARAARSPRRDLVGVERVQPDVDARLHVVEHHVAERRRPTANSTSPTRGTRRGRSRPRASRRRCRRTAARPRGPAPGTARRARRPTRAAAARGPWRAAARTGPTRAREQLALVGEVRREEHDDQDLAELRRLEREAARPGPTAGRR